MITDLQMDISAVNNMTYEEFMSKFGNVVERCSLCAAAVWDERPYEDVVHFSQSIAKIIDDLPVSAKKGLLRHIPDLAGRMAQSGGLSKESTYEQKSAGLLNMSDEERMKINSLNEKYKRKFGFPFVICARKNKKDTILEALEKRLKNCCEQEINTVYEMDISAVNSMSYEEFISKFGNVVEHCSLCAAAVWREHPFNDVAQLSRHIAKFIDDLPLSGKEGILRLHPDLAGRIAQSGGLTKESTNEQKSAGLNDMTDDERMKMNRMNEQYKQKFGFPFVICARQNKKAAILEGLERRLNNSAEQEAITGANEVKKICDLRLRDIVDPTSSKL
ncbi:hypothetical protein FSP39_023654 [Pinctada imbricata]|uniref:2-oxo-4-hydroxy-4-carboxy-5-ureidoimidazoline decarboxylase n=1 Tax=Pinctada imbricata TaxID=66713 RepID=A0AA88Y6P1_PINIB|nr:hypothetical protein FSP39_023654 [Pinctada imbricata]